MNDKNLSFITPQRLRNETLSQLFNPRPKWLLMWTEAVGRERLEQIEDPELLMVVVVGKKYPASETLRPSQVAILYEATRYAHTVVMNPNSSKKNKRFYLRISFNNRASDLLTATRVWKNLSGTEAAHSGLIPSDKRPESLSVEYGAQGNKDARSILMEHAKSSAIKAGLSDADHKLYLDNLLALFELIDSEEKRGSTLAA